ncbi:hypothetical protein MBANPS3_003033 [Mucor bainieri]
MHFFSLSTLVFTLTALLANQQVSAAAVGNQDACVKQAYAIYDGFTRNGCNVNRNDQEEVCRTKFETAIRDLNRNLDECGRSDYVTLCRLIPGGGFFSFSKCSSLQEDHKLSKADCEAKKSQDYLFTGVDGAKKVFKAGDSKS